MDEVKLIVKEPRRVTIVAEYKFPTSHGFSPLVLNFFPLHVSIDSVEYTEKKDHHIVALSVLNKPCMVTVNDRKQSVSNTIGIIFRQAALQKPKYSIPLVWDIYDSVHSARRITTYPKMYRNGFRVSNVKIVITFYED